VTAQPVSGAAASPVAGPRSQSRRWRASCWPGTKGGPGAGAHQVAPRVTKQRHQGLERHFQDYPDSSRARAVRTAAFPSIRPTPDHGKGRPGPRTEYPRCGTRASAQPRDTGDSHPLPRSPARPATPPHPGSPRTSPPRRRAWLAGRPAPPPSASAPSPRQHRRRIAQLSCIKLLPAFRTHSGATTPHQPARQALTPR
jgi:hypothetical protein